MGPGDKTEPTIPDLGSREYELVTQQGRRKVKVHVAPVRRPLLAVSQLNDKGWDCHFMANGHAWVEHSTTEEITVFERVGGRFDLVADVETPTVPQGPGPRL